MRPLDFLTRRPALSLGVVVAVFLAWVVADATGPRPKPQTSADAVEPTATAELNRMRSVGAGLGSIHEGMPRTEVEARLGRPAPRDIRPFERANGKVVYRTHYPAFLNQALSIAPNVAGYCEAVLEYDASSPGHPLLSVTAVPRTAPGVTALVVAT